MILFCVLSVDPALGKIDTYSLSQETLVELLVEGFTKNKEHICGTRDATQGISRWKGIRSNDSGNIIEINWFHFALKGSLDLKWLPPTTTKVNVSWNKLSGTVDLTCLPRELEVLSIGNNQFQGTIDLTNLPTKLTNLAVYNNKLHGETDFSQLPQAMVYLDVQDTELEGTIFELNGQLLNRRSYVKDMRQKGVSQSMHN